ncbi:hypothetical protein RP20_CCG017541 [Aedes albopictus]|nr:hypothetical protein RP20_CCG017541 [Aedes albopictus]
MRNVWILVASALLAFANFVKSQDTARNLYSSRYDNLDIDTILGSSRLVNNYVDCLLSRKPCPPEGKDLKRTRRHPSSESFSKTKRHRLSDVIFHTTRARPPSTVIGVGGVVYSLPFVCDRLTPLLKGARARV